jgi:hypothetical protein
MSTHSNNQEPADLAPETTDLSLDQDGVDLSQVTRATAPRATGGTGTIKVSG